VRGRLEDRVGRGNRSASDASIHFVAGLSCSFPSEPWSCDSVAVLADLIGLPITVSNLLMVRFSSFDEVVDVDPPVPNFHPPDIRRPCFFDKLDRRRKVEKDLDDSCPGSSITSMVGLAGELPVVCEVVTRFPEWDVVRDGGIGYCAGLIGNASEADVGGTGTVANPVQPLPLQLLACEAGYSDTGRTFLCRFGVTCG
jgi:hypothetical protein